MSNLPNDSDSTQLGNLHAAFKAATAQHATADRLGAFARQTGVAITDFGAHSERWITQSRRAMPA